MVNYGTGKVYKITSDQTDQVYVGSTCGPLSQRMAVHRSNIRAHAAGKTNYTTSFAIVQYDDAVITLIEDCPCENKEQLHRRERFHIEATPNCVNRYIPGRTDAERRQANWAEIAVKKAEWYDDNREQIAAKKAEHYQVNREELLAKAADYYQVNRDQIAAKQLEYRQANREQIAAKKAEYHQANRERLAAKAAEKIVCECGAESTTQHHARHLRSAKHMRFVAAEPEWADLLD